MKYLIIYFLFINLYGFFIMYYDKQKAKKSEWRISEAKLFGVSILFGSLGILLGMFTFRHKTKHLKFLFGIPTIMLIQIYILFKTVILQQALN